MILPGPRPTAERTTMTIDRTDADVARDEQAREHDAAAQDEAAQDARDAEVDLLNALDDYARRALGLMGLTDAVLIAGLDAATAAITDARGA